MALRTPLSVTPHLYMGDSTGRPLDMGTVYFGEQDKDPEFYPIDLFSDDALTKPLAQPVHTKGGYLYDKGDMVEPHAKELIYSVKVLDSYGRKVFYKGAMMRNSWNDDVIEQINAALVSTAEEAAQIATDVAKDIADKAVINSGFVTIDSFELGATLTQRNQALRHAADGKLYRWAGDLPKVVPASSTPASSGGIGANTWLEVSDVLIRQELTQSPLLGKGAAIVNGALVMVEDISELKLMAYRDGEQVSVSKPYSGVFRFNATNLSGSVALDSKNDFFVAPASAPTGASGAWVRVSGVPTTTSFVTPIVENSRLFSSTDGYEYIYHAGAWSKTVESLEYKFNDHKQSNVAHGLNANNLALGNLSTASGDFAVSVGKSNNSVSGVSVGRENISKSGVAIGRENNMNSAFGIAIGTRNAVNIADADVRAAMVFGNDNTVANTSKSLVIGDFAKVTDVAKSVVFDPIGKLEHKDLVDSFVFAGGRQNTNATAAVVLGNAAYVTGKDAANKNILSTCVGASSRVDSTGGFLATSGTAIGAGSKVLSAGANNTGGIALGASAESRHNNSIAIGYNVVTVADNQIMLGAASHKTQIAGSLNIAGALTSNTLNVTDTKNFNIPHPVPAKSKTHRLIHASYEGDVEGGTIYRHALTTVDGVGVKELPEWFMYLNKDAVVHITPDGHFGAAYGYVVNNTLTITSNTDGLYNVLILGTRKDANVQNWKGVEVLNDNA